MAKKKRWKKKKPRVNPLLRRWREWRGRNQLKRETSSLGKYPTVKIDVIKKFSRGFGDSFPETELSGRKRSMFVVTAGIGAFESPLAAQIKIKPLAGHEKTAERTKTGSRIPRNVVAEARLGFQENAVVIEALQGEPGRQRDFERFREMHGKPFDYLLEKVEEHARKLGFGQVKIRAPESIYNYHHPYLWQYKTEMDGGKLAQETRDRMIALYYGTAKSLGYKRRGNFFVKLL